MTEPKELDEAIEKAAIWLHDWEFEGAEDWENLDDTIKAAFKSAMVELFKSLLGEGWRLAIVKDDACIEATSGGLGMILSGVPSDAKLFKQVIWQAGDAQ